MNKLQNSKGVRLHRSKVVLAYELLTWLVPLGLVYYLLRFPILPLPHNVAVRMPGSGLDWICGALAVLAVVEIVRRYHDELYILGSLRIMHLTGRASFKLRRVSITYQDVVEIRINQSIFGRIFGFGTLCLSTASVDPLEIQFHDVPTPRAVCDFIEEVTNALPPRYDRGLKPLTD